MPQVRGPTWHYLPLSELASAAGGEAASLAKSPGRVVQAVGDAWSAIPVVGTFGDLVSTGGSLLQGDFKGAAIAASTILVPGVGAAEARIGATAVEKGASALGKKVAKGAEKSAHTSRAARREAMRDAGNIPTSQAPVSQSRNASGREYSYDVPAPGGGTQRVSVQQQTMDTNHPGQAHWEAGRVKTDPLTGAVRETKYKRPALTNDKSKVNY